jgi:hypothetical protein
MLADLLTWWNTAHGTGLVDLLGGPIQTVEGLGGLSILAYGIKITRCHHDGCKKRWRFTHGHLRLCEIHHPLVPDDGVVTQEHIDQIRV